MARSRTSPFSNRASACHGAAIRRATPCPRSIRRSARHKTTLLFVNTRSQSELLFQELWKINEDNLPIALHHGSLDVSQRRKVEQAPWQTNSLRAIVATSTLDLGIDWGDVDLVVHVGAPKGAARLAQRIGRANHRMDEPSKAILVPANRFEVMECQAALDANYLGSAGHAAAGRRRARRVVPAHPVHGLRRVRFMPTTLYAEIVTAAPYPSSTRDTCSTGRCNSSPHGGYALQSYERYARIRETQDGTWRMTHPSVAQQYR